MILHIASYFSGSKVYKNLVEALDKLDVSQTVYVPVRSEGDIGKNSVKFKTSSSRIIYRRLLTLYTRLNFSHKIKKILTDAKQQLDASSFSIIHAHTLYSDGAVAYALFKQYNVPYVITVRSTDINVFFKYFPHLRKQAKDVLLHAKKVIFLSSVYKDRFLSQPYFDDCRDELNNKSVAIPNGVDEFWLDNLYHNKKSIASPPTLLYVGELIKRKNAAKLVTAVAQLNHEGYACKLAIAGNNGAYENMVKQMAIKNPKWLQYHGKIEERQKLLELYRQCDLFIMPSIYETFGLVYVEALSQGLPIIYTKNEGIDGYFDKNTGEGLQLPNIENIKLTIKSVLNNYEYYNFEPAVVTEPFNWNNIAGQCLALYLEN